MFMLVFFGLYGVIIGTICCVVARHPNGRAVRFLDMLTGQRAPDTPAFRRYHQRLNLVVGLSNLSIGVWALAYVGTDFGHELSTNLLGSSLWVYFIGTLLFLAFPHGSSERRGLGHSALVFDQLFYLATPGFRPASAAPVRWLIEMC